MGLGDAIMNAGESVGKTIGGAAEDTVDFGLDLTANTAGMVIGKGLDLFKQTTNQVLPDLLPILMGIGAIVLLTQL